MGQITIDIPQHFDANFRLVEHDAVGDLLTKVRDLVSRANQTDFDQIAGLWADRDEPADEIADRLRGSWKRKLHNGRIPG